MITPPSPPLHANTLGGANTPPEATAKAAKYRYGNDQPAAASLLAQILTHAAMELFDAAALHDRGQMWEEARAIASRVLAACPSD